MDTKATGYKLLFGNVAVLTIFYLGIDFVLRYGDISVLQAMSWGWGSAMIVATPFFLSRAQFRQKLIHEWKTQKSLIFETAFFTVLAGGLLVWGIEKAGSGPSVLLENLQPIFATMLGVMFLKERFTKGEALSGVIMLGGIFLIANLRGEVPPIAVLGLTISSFFYAFHSFIFKQYGATADVLYFIYWRGLVGAILINIFVLAAGKFTIPSWDVLALLAVIYLVGIFVARYFFFHAHRYLGIAKIHIFLLLQPVGVLVGTFLFFNDPMGWQKLLGAGLILGGGYFFMKSRKVEG